MSRVITELGLASNFPSWHPARVNANRNYQKLIDTQEAIVHGRQLLLDWHKVEPSPSQIVWHLLGESMVIWKVQPDAERTWLKSGFRAQKWEIMLSQQDWFEVELARMIDGIETPEVRADPVDTQANLIDVAMVVSEWFRFLNNRRNPRQFVRLVAEASAREFLRETPARIYGMLRSRGFRDPCRALKDLRQRASGQIIVGLRASLGLRATARGFII